MTRVSSIGLACLAISVVILSSCTNARSDAPAAPTMPSHWKVTSDQSFAPADIQPVAQNLGGNIAALRNTVYDVNGKRVKLNTIVAADAASADKIMVALRGMKPADFLLRKGMTLYEFVVANDAIPEAREGKAHLQSHNQ